jgi:hypothetical protein
VPPVSQVGTQTALFVHAVTPMLISMTPKVQVGSDLGTSLTVPQMR